MFVLLYGLPGTGGKRKKKGIDVVCLMILRTVITTMGWLWLVGSIKLYVSFAKEPYKRDNILQKRHVILSIPLTEATPYM